MARTQKNTLNNTKKQYVKHEDATYIQKKTIFLCFSFVVFYDFLNDFFCKKYWVTALVRTLTIIGGLNQF